MGFIKTFRQWFAPAPQRVPLETTVSQDGVQARAIRHLITHGCIDAWTILQFGTTDCHKMLSRLRRMGFLYPLDDPRSFSLHQNAKGGAKHRRHYWTGKVPANWVATSGYVGDERRKKPRGEWIS